MMSRYALISLVGCLSSLLLWAPIHAAVIAEDNATDAAYADGWTAEDDGGTGFGPWQGPGSYGAVPIMEIDTDAAEPDNDLGTPAFRIATGGIAGEFYLERPFENPMQAGQTFTIDIDAYSITPTEEPGRDELIRFSSAGGERISLYAYRYDDGAGTTFGTDFWGINATSANDNLAGGVSLPMDPLGGIEWQTSYTTTDSSDGFTLKLELPTIDTYHLVITDDSVTKLDISGQLFGGATAGQGINELVLYGSETTPLSTEPGGVLYFTNMRIESPESLPGDFDNDGDVDGRDFLVWQRNTSVGSLADWQDNYGAPGPAAVTSVPEPTTMAICSISLLFSIGLARFQTRRKILCR